MFVVNANKGLVREYLSKSQINNYMNKSDKTPSVESV